MAGKSDGKGHRGQCGCSLGDHSTSDDATSNELSSFPDIHLMEFGGDVVLIPQHARHICHQNKLLSLEGGCNLRNR